MRRATVMLVAALAAAVVPSAVAATPKATFVAKADAICERAAERTDALIDAYPQDDPTSPATPDKDVKAFAPVLVAVIATTRGEIRALRALTPPRAVKSDWAAALDAYARATDILARAIPAARRADRAGMVAALQASAPFSRRASTLARRVGMRACGNM